jgi:hypothetical protein
MVQRGEGGRPAVEMRVRESDAGGPRPRSSRLLLHSAFFPSSQLPRHPPPPRKQLSTMPKVAKAANVPAAGGKKKLAEPVKAAPPPKEVREGRERKRRDATARGRWHVGRERTRARPSRRRRPWAGPCCPRPPRSTPTDHALGIQLPIAPGVGEPARGFVARERVTSRGAARREKDPGRRPALFFFLFFSRFLLPTPRQDSSSDDSSSEDDSESEGLAAGTPAANGVRWVGRGRGEGGRRGGTRAPRLLDSTPMGVASHVGGRRGQCFPAHPPRTAALSVAKRVLGA